jgi:hypothetical protein
MKFSFLVSAILLGASARTVTAMEVTCCYADVKLGCPSDYEDVSAGGNVAIDGVQTNKCCLPNEAQVDSMELCNGTITEPTLWNATITDTDDDAEPGGDDGVELIGVTSTVTETSTHSETSTSTTGSGNAGAKTSGAGIISTAPAAFIGATVAIIVTLL